MINLQEKETKEIIQLYSMAIKELKHRGVIRTNNVVGELGDWNTFLMNKRWHSRMHAWNLLLTKKVCQQCKIVYEKEK